MNIPRWDHPVWRRLVTGEVPFQPTFLGACMLLAHARAALRRPGGASHTMRHMGQLRAVYAQNVECSSARRDLAVLRMNEIFSEDADCGGWFKEETFPGGVNVPASDHPVWQRFVNGEVLFQPSFLGARLLLTHARADLRAGGSGRTVRHMGRLRALYAQNAECGSARRDLARLSAAARAQPTAAARRRDYAMSVVAADGSEYDLPADTVTRDEPAGGTQGPYVPLAFRPQGAVFYVCSARWSALEGVALCLKYSYRVHGCRSSRGGSRRG